MTCGDAHRLLVREDATASERVELAAHLAGCLACREDAELLRGDVVDEFAPATTLAVGDRIDRYQIIRVLGSGGMSVVFEARHVELKKRVALKVLHRTLVASPEANARFARDASLVARLKGEHICRVNMLGRMPDGEPYMVLEFLDGEDLCAKVARQGPLPVATSVDYVLQASIGIAEAHHYGIIHRDIKPANLFRVLRPDGSALIKVLDFGIAKVRADARLDGLTRTGMPLGSMPYMSPEQLRSSKSVDERTDVWSLAATLHHLVVGEPPFGIEPAPIVALRIWDDEPSIPRHVPPGLAAAIARALHKDPRDRHVDIAELAIALAPFGSANARASSERIERILRR